MRLDKLYIQQFKNLFEFYIDFDERELTTVLIGRNGMGKSNVIEALVIIFRNLDLGEDPEFRYKLTYICRGETINVDADPERVRNKTQVTFGEETMSLSKFRQVYARSYFPSTVFGYYSGPSNRLEQHFDKHQDIFYDQLIYSKEEEEEELLRPLFYTRLIHSQFVLLAFYSFEQRGLKKFLQDYLSIIELESVLFVLKEPPWAQSQKRKHPNDIFWGAEAVVRRFLETLYDQALAPIKDGDYVYLYLKDLDSLRVLAEKYLEATRFFKRLESTYISKMIAEVRIRVRKEGVPSALTFSELSEGEQQLLTVLGLLRFTKEEESLFLLDEPDTHLNPAWKLEYMDLLERVVGKNASSQIILATHDPIVIGGLIKEQVRILTKNSQGESECYPPAKDPAGMGIPALLTSDVFGLRTSLDLKTQGMLDRKGQLIVKLHKGTLTDKESRSLVRLNRRLRLMGFNHSVDDPLYSKFLEVMSEYQEELRPALTNEEREDQDRLAREIVEVLKGKKNDIS
jgi:predicted ATPase